MSVRIIRKDDKSVEETKSTYTNTYEIIGVMDDNGREKKVQVSAMDANMAKDKCAKYGFKEIKSVKQIGKVHEGIEDTPVQSAPKLNDEEGFSLSDISDAFCGFASKYASVEEAIDNIGKFVDESYEGNKQVDYRNMIRTGYRQIVNDALEARQANLEKRLLRVV